MSPRSTARHLRFWSMRPSAKNPPYERGRGCCVPGCAGRSEIVVMAFGSSTKMTCARHAGEWTMSSACRLARLRGGRDSLAVFADWANRLSPASPQNRAVPVLVSR